MTEETATKRALTREEILGSADRKTEEVEVPEWGGTVTVSELTAADRDRFDAFVLKVREAGEEDESRLRIRTLLVVLCASDAQGNRLFSNDDVEIVSRRSFRAVNRLYQVAARLSGLTKEEREKLGGN